MHFLILSILLLSQTASTNTRNGLALQGYDPVSYFSNNPKAGNPQITTTYRGDNYYFASIENKEVFLSDPKRYAPVYGGWCAYAMGIDGSQVKIDPLTYKIIDDRLYLFYNFKGNNTLDFWSENELILKSNADEFWNTISKD